MESALSLSRFTATYQGNPSTPLDNTLHMA